MKITKRLIAGIAAAILAFSAGACTVERFDPNKTQIFVKYFPGGNGSEWIEALQQEFNAANERYEIVLRPQKMSASAVVEEVRAGNATADVYLMSDIAYQEGIYRDLFEDLSDVLEMKPDGDSGETVGAKMKNADGFIQMASKNGDGCYIIPHTESIIGLVYDHDRFVENGWLYFADDSDKEALDTAGIEYSETTEYGTKYIVFESAEGKVNYEQGDKILKPGKDGEYGTYDDGQPQTEQEFKEMLLEITQGNEKAKTIVYNGVYDNYLNRALVSIMGQYMGIDALDAYFTYDSKGEELPMYGGGSEAITLENGYRVFKTEGVYQGLRFLNDYFNDSASIDRDSEKTTSYSHTDAQNDYILSYKDDSGYPAMLFEGAWWENEARVMLAQVAETAPERGYGKVDYRYMLYPEIGGQKGIDGNGDGTVFATMDTSGWVVVKSDDREKVDKIKEFIAMSCSDEHLKEFTRMTGVQKAFDYELSDSDLQAMSLFARNVWELTHDTENIVCYNYEILQKAQPVFFIGGMSNTEVPVYDSGIYNVNIIRALRNKKDVDNMMTAVDGSGRDIVGYSASAWAGFIQTAKNNGFYGE